MKALSDLWVFLDGKKTILGAVCMFIAHLLTDVVMGYWHFNPEWMQPLIDTVKYFGEGFTGVGILHKITKPKT